LQGATLSRMRNVVWNDIDVGVALMKLCWLYNKSCMKRKGKDPNTIAEDLRAFYRARAAEAEKMIQGGLGEEEGAA